MSGVRGQLTDPNSRRGRRVAQPRTPAAAEEITFPEHFGTVQEIWKDLRDKLVEAGLPLQQKDAYSIECVAHNLSDLRLTEAGVNGADTDAKVRLGLLKLRASLIKDVMKHLHMIGATTVATLRLVKPVPKDQNESETALNALFSS